MARPAPRRQGRRPERVIVSVDVGGTFTDVVVQRDGRVDLVYKLPTDLRNPEKSVRRALRAVAEGDVGELVHATTLATNALLTGTALEGGRTALLTTSGFADVIEIGRQNRPELYNLAFERRRPLIPPARRYEVEQREWSRGRVRSRLKPTTLARVSSEVKRGGVNSVAVSFLHSYADPRNERLAGSYLRRRFRYVSLSCETAPEPREYERTSTTAVNAVLMPIVSEYLENLTHEVRALSGANLSVMSSSGGVIPFHEAVRRPVEVVESGPAAGVIAAGELAKTLGIRDAISFDMGGTTAKAGTVHDGLPGVTSEFEVGGATHHGRRTKGSGYPIRFPFVDLVEVSAGGGTIISSDSQDVLSIGPRSAGAEPGPACYGRGGTEPTLTDANLVIGTLGDALLGGSMPLDRGAALRSLRRLGRPYKVAAAALRLADLEMARAIRLVTVERGLDPARFVLIAFGGSGPQHAVRIAEELGVRRVIVPPRAGLFSAEGLLVSDWKFEARRSHPTDIPRAYAELEAGLNRAHGRVAFQRLAGCRYSHQGSELTVRVRTASREAIVREFERLHKATFGFRLKREVEIVTIRVFAVAGRTKPVWRRGPPTQLRIGQREATIDGTRSSLRTFNRSGLPEAAVVPGPASVDDYDSSLFLPSGWTGVVGRLGEITAREGSK